MQCGLEGTNNFFTICLNRHGSRCSNKANSRTAVLLRSATRTAVFCKQCQKSKKKPQMLIGGMAVFHQLWGDKNPGQQTILVLLGQQPRMPMREQRFLIIYKEILAIQTTITSANLRNSCFHQPSQDSSSPRFAGTAVHLNLLMSEQQFLICYNGMLTIETAVSSAKFLKQSFSQALVGGGGVVPHVFCQDAVHLNSAGTTSGKQRQQFLCKLMAQDKDCSPLQMNTTGQGRSPLQMNTTRQGLQSFANEYH